MINCGSINNNVNTFIFNADLSKKANVNVDNLTTAGIIYQYGGGSAPSGWLVCDGSAISRTTYKNLFNAIGTTYGTGDGSTTFNLPNISSIVKSVNTSVPIKGNGSDVYVNASDGSATGRLVRMFTDGKIGYGGAAISSNQNLRFGSADGNAGLVGTATRVLVNFKFIIKY